MPGAEYARSQYDKKFKDKAPTGLLSIEFDHEGKIWFDTM